MGFEAPTAPLNGGYGNGERRREAVLEDLARRGRWRGGWAQASTRPRWSPARERSSRGSRGAVGGGAFGLV
jgi:hypothetical protein